jgi:hypothetical protein
MAKCDLSIELDDPDRVYAGGEKITGTVHVDVDADVTCKGLDVQTNWRTHGRGNVAKGTSESATLYEGQWIAGQHESYRFELEVPAWPPSYHGNYINVDHYVDVRAKIPWAFDPKASQDYVMRPRTAPDARDLSSKATAVSGCFGYAILAIVLIGFSGALLAIAAGLLANPLVGMVVAAIVLPLIGLGVGKVFLPRWLLGNVEADLLTPSVAPGETIRVTLAMQPKRNATINAITAELVGEEVCISGSGSNRTTHRNAFFHDKQTLQTGTTLQAGARKEFEFEVQLPDDVPYSFDLDDNDLNWKVDLRVDIPRWPDWTKSLKLEVLPSDGAPAAETRPTERHDAPTATAGEEPSPDDITFKETATHLWQLREDDDQVDMLVEAVNGMTFDLETYIERRLLYSGTEDPHVYEDGYAVWARYPEPPLPLVLYIPSDLADEFEQAGRSLWPCRGTIVGWDHDHGRLQIKVLPT